jgi:hypothetical protein
LDFSTSQASKVGGGQRLHLEQHDAVAAPAQLGALAAEGLADVGIVDLEVETGWSDPGRRRA